MNGDMAISVPMTWTNNAPRTLKDITKVVKDASLSESHLKDFHSLKACHCQRYQPNFQNSYFTLCFLQVVGAYRAQSAKKERKRELGNSGVDPTLQLQTFS